LELLLLLLLLMAVGTLSLSLLEDNKDNEDITMAHQVQASGPHPVYMLLILDTHAHTCWHIHFSHVSHCRCWTLATSSLCFDDGCAAAASSSSSMYEGLVGG